MAKEIKATEFTEAVSAHSLVLVDFWAPWCAPCQALAPVVEALNQEVGDKVFICKINIDEEFEIAKQQGISSIPTLVLFKNGLVVERMTGVLAKEQILDVIQKFY